MSQALPAKAQPSTAPAWWPAGLIDLALIAAFALAGRRSHERDAVLSGYVTTLWPFAAGLVAGWLITRAWRQPYSPLRSGIGIWLSALGGGMLLRALSDQGTAASFVVVATVILGALLVGWRLISTRLVRKPTGPQHQHDD